MSNKRKISLDKFITSLEEMIDARDDMWEEEKYSNYRRMEDIKVKRYEPARENVRYYLEKIIDQISIENDLISAKIKV